MYFQASPKTNYEIVNEYNREGTLYFTQGLSFKDSKTLLESSGIYGQSEIHYLSFPDLKVSNQQVLSKDYFGEGSDIILNGDKNEIYQLTWREKKVFKYDESMNLLDSKQLPDQIAEGWGMTHYIDEDGQSKLLITDGSNKIYTLDPKTWKVENSVSVVDEKGQPINDLNEIELYNDAVLANVFLKNTIVKIDYKTGKVLDTFDMEEITNKMESKNGYQQYSKKNQNYCLNGIAYDKSSDTLLITGKKWPTIFEIKLIDKQN